METLVFTLAPFLFLDGYHLFHWNRPLWLLLWGLGALWVSFVIVNPALSHYEGAAKASVAWLATLLLIQALVALSPLGILRAAAAPAGAPCAVARTQTALTSDLSSRAAERRCRCRNAREATARVAP